MLTKVPALAIALALLLCVADAAAQNRSAELDKAYQEARDAYNALQEAQARRDQAVESLPGERQSSASGGSHPTGNYFVRQAILEQQLELARQHYRAAMKRWNDLK
ncbi:MAG TPA: hypothetical protein VFV74_11085 [Burkholderiales bacterium]|nr:hypothetical protein [Burkholderiales bacterium]